MFWILALLFLGSVSLTHADSITCFGFNDQDLGELSPSDDGQFVAVFGRESVVIDPVTGLISDGIPEWLDGPSGEDGDFALLFEPTDLITISDEAGTLAWSAERSFSIEWKWFSESPLVPGDVTSFISYGSSLDGAVALIASEFDPLSFTLLWGGVTFAPFQSSGARWQHVVLSHDAEQGEMILLANGEEIDRVQAVPVWAEADINALLVGPRGDFSNGHFFFTALDDLCFHDGVVSVEDIAWYSPPPPPPAPEPFVPSLDRFQITYQSSNGLLPVIDVAPERIASQIEDGFSLFTFLFQDTPEPSQATIQITYRLDDGTSFVIPVLLATQVPLVETILVHDVINGTLRVLSLREVIEDIPLPDGFDITRLRGIELQAFPVGEEQAGLLFLEGVEFIEEVIEQPVVQPPAPRPELRPGAFAVFYPTIEGDETLNEPPAGIFLNEDPISLLQVDAYVVHEDMVGQSGTLQWINRWADGTEQVIELELPAMGEFFYWFNVRYDADMGILQIRRNEELMGDFPFAEGNTLVDLQRVELRLSEEVSLEPPLRFLEGVVVTPGYERPTPVDPVPEPIDPDALFYYVGFPGVDGPERIPVIGDLIAEAGLTATLEAHVHNLDQTIRVMTIEYIESTGVISRVYIPLPEGEEWVHITVRHDPPGSGTHYFVNGDLVEALLGEGTSFVPGRTLSGIELSLEEGSVSYIETVHIHPLVVPDSTIEVLAGRFVADRMPQTSISSWALY